MSASLLPVFPLSLNLAGGFAEWSWVWRTALVTSDHLPLIADFLFKEGQEQR